jgi:hypothetical protein
MSKPPTLSTRSRIAENRIASLKGYPRSAALNYLFGCLSMLALDKRPGKADIVKAMERAMVYGEEVRRKELETGRVIPV